MDAQVLQGDIDVLLTLRGKPIPTGSSRAEYIKALARELPENSDRCPRHSRDTRHVGRRDLHFPNVMILPHAGNAMIYRVRPAGNDPDRCTFEIFSTRSYPTAVKPPRATLQRVTDLDDPEQVLEIPRQDLGNIPRMQKGLHSRAMRQTWLASHHEKMILNMHQEMDRYLQA
ncbi:MAG: hypothetical protein IPF57_14100 [Gammaproteobacteria bacterium]|nr:hypothetical protein [Gammaproteobacteria bacterium]